MPENHDAFSLAKTYIHLSGETDAAPVPVDDRFWATIDSREELHRGRLVTLSKMERDWDHWEMHPAGEEVVFVMSGALDLVLELPEGERRASLTQGHAVIVPRGVWHWGAVREPCNVLAITPGQGTRHREARS